MTRPDEMTADIAARTRILVVEDSRTQAEHLCGILEQHGYAVEVAENGVRALERLEKLQPALILSDIVMPEMDGYELCRRIRADPRIAQIPIVLLTSLAETRDVVQGLECGADGFVTKPFSKEYLLAHIQQTLAGHRLRSASGERVTVEIAVADAVHTVSADPQQMLMLLLSTYEAAAFRNTEMHRAQEQLQNLNERLEEIVEERTAALTREVAEHTLAEERLRVFAAELEHSNIELEQFAHIATHDLQEPLRSITSFTQLLARRYHGRLDEEADAYIGFAVASARRMQELIEDLLAYSRVGTRGKPFGPTEMNAVLAGVLEDLAVAIAENGAVIEWDQLPTVLGDNAQLARLLMNLIANALKFHGAAAPRVHVGATRLPGAWEFSVRDNGIGIEPQHFEKIFVIFQRLHAVDAYPGTGTGLAVCKKIVERHGGAMRVESTPGESSTFFFTIPDAKATE